MKCKKDSRPRCRSSTTKGTRDTDLPNGSPVLFQFSRACHVPAGVLDIHHLELNPVAKGKYGVKHLRILGLRLILSLLLQ